MFPVDMYATATRRPELQDAVQRDAGSPAAAAPDTMAASSDPYPFIGPDATARLVGPVQVADEAATPQRAQSTQHHVHVYAERTADA